MNQIAIIGDTHIPFEKTEAIIKALKIIKTRKPDTIIVNGDLIDCWEISKYDKVPNFSKLLKEELVLGYHFLQRLREENPYTKIYLIEGNHEFRIKTYVIRNAPSVYDRNFIPEKLNLSSLDIEWIPTKESSARWSDTYIVLDNIHIGHFDRVNQGAGQTVRQLMIKKGGSFVQSHIHRGAVIYFTDIDGKLSFGLEVPCLCKPAYYGSITDWQVGMGFLNKNDNGEWRPELIVF